MMLMEFHDKDGNIILVNLGMFLYCKLGEFGDTDLTFVHGTTISIKETPEEIRRSISAMAQQAMIRGGH